jgi:hypothetical protein
MSRKAKYHAGLALVVLLAAGCGRRLPPQMDAAEAKAAVTAALDAWANGETPQQLRQRKPPVDFKDLHWDRGSKLTKYEVEAERASGASAAVTVKLHLTETSGARSTRVVVYHVDAGRTIVVRPNTLTLD